MAADVFRETAGNPNVVQKVVQNSQVLGLAGLGASYSASGRGAVTYESAANFVLGPGVLNPDGVLNVGLFNPTFSSPHFDQMTFEILDNGTPLEAQSFTSESQAMQFFDDNVLTFNLTGQSSGYADLDFEYSFTAQRPGAGFRL